jgi:hypothetical protein
MKTYVAVRVNGADTLGGAMVQVDDDGTLYPLAPRNDLKDMSDGFNWGYGGSGPAQLALAILSDYLENDEAALSLFQAFKFRVIAGLPQEEGWTLTGEEIGRAIDAILSDVE